MNPLSNLEVKKEQIQKNEIISETLLGVDLLPATKIRRHKAAPRKTFLRLRVFETTWRYHSQSAITQRRSSDCLFLW